jgi:arylsulfatase A-like enzyme
MFRNAFCAAPSCSGSRAALLTGEYCHTNGMMGLAHRGFSLNDYDHQLVRVLKAAGYHSELIGEQHISADPGVLGYDVVHEIPDTRVHSVGPSAIETLRSGIREPFFMSVGFFETHRSFFAPSSVRDRVYSLPPPFLPDTPEIREDVAAYKASARSLDHGVGSVLNALQETRLDERTLVIFTTDHGLAFPTAKASLLDRGIGVSLIIRGPGFTGGRGLDELVSHLDIFPTVCEAAGVPTPPWALGRSLAALVAGEEAPGPRSAIFSELTYHAAYEPQRAVRTQRHKYIRRFGDRDRPVLPNTDDGPTKDLLLRLGWGERRIPFEQLYDLAFDPSEAANVVDDPEYAEVRRDLSERLERWMRDTADPLLDGPVAPPPGAEINLPDQISPSEPTVVVG